VRRIAAIALLLLLLFNVLGFYGIFMGLQYQNRQQLVERFDAEQYDESQTITFKVPLSIPYAGDRQDYVRVDGEFENEGEFFHMIKQRLSQDTLYVVCVNDQQSKRIHRAMTDYVRTFSDDASGAQDQSKTIVPTFIKEYLIEFHHVDRSSLGWAQPVSQHGTLPVFIPAFQTSIIHPPERA
jgi:hypothetical protein